MDHDLSYSMYIDEGHKNINENIDSTCQNDQFKEINKRNIYSWVKDDAVNECYNCNIGFTLFNRRHHCRGCGRIFCHSCSSKRIELSKDIGSFPRSPESNIILSFLKNYSNVEKEVRVCNICYARISQLNELWYLIKLFELLNMNLLDLRKIECVCINWRRAVIVILSSFRELQYTFPNYKFTNREKKLLWLNRNFLSGHSKWIVKLLKIANYDNYEDIKELLTILKKNKKDCKCWYTMCTRYCSSKLLPQDALELLDNTIKNNDVKEYVIKCLNNASNEELECYIPVIVRNLRYDSNHSLSKMIMNRCLKSNRILFNLYWELLVHSDSENFKQLYLDEFNKFLEFITENIGKDTLNNIIRSHGIIQILDKLKNIDNLSEYKFRIKKHILEFDTFIKEDSILPINSDFIINDIDFSNIKICNSASKPIIIPFNCINKSNEKVKYEMMYKSEDIRKDQIVMCIIKLMKMILKKEENIDLFIKTYDIIPTNANGGMIEIVQNSETLYNLKENLKYSILNYIMENNTELSVKKVRERFIKSTAAFSVITYLLGIGDRHLDNIMITDKGELFHIDFGFILGFDPKPLAPDMRITPEMVEAIGGENSSNYMEFKKICTTVYNCLRRHTNIFMYILSLLPDADPPINKNLIQFSQEQLTSEIINRFLPGQSHEEAKIQFTTHMENSTKSSNIFIDFFHYHNKEDTIRKNIKGIASNAYNSLGNGLNKISRYFLEN